LLNSQLLIYYKQNKQHKRVCLKNNVRTALFWAITQHTVSGQTTGPILKGQEFLTVEDGTDRLSWNAGMELPLHAA
jgi:hypothetical protein